MPSKPEPARVHWECFPNEETCQKIIDSAKGEAKKSNAGPPVPYQFTLRVMSQLYSKLMPDVEDDGESAADPNNYKKAGKADIRAIAYFSWHNDRKLFVTRRVYPSYFDFFSLSFVYEGWGALGELLQDIGKSDFSQRLFTKVPDVWCNHRFLPFLKEAHRLDYKAALVIPFFGVPGQSVTFTKANLKGAMVFYLSKPEKLPHTNSVQRQVAIFSRQFAKLVISNEREIEKPVQRTKPDIKDHVWQYWEGAKECSQALVFAELSISGIIRSDNKENIMLDGAVRTLRW